MTNSKNENNEIREISITELDAVSGGKPNTAGSKFDGMSASGGVGGTVERTWSSNFWFGI
jgi:hypothetical protein